MYDPKAQFHALRSFKCGGVNYKRGDKFDIGEISARHRVIFFQQSIIGYASDFTYNKSSVKEVEIEKEAPAEPAKEEALVEETPTESSDSDVATVVVDDEDDFQVVYKGVQFEINRNQIREDGTLTAGALKSYKAAIA
jgi:hypothetical protein